MNEPDFLLRALADDTVDDSDPALAEARRLRIGGALQQSAAGHRTLGLRVRESKSWRRSGSRSWLAIAIGVGSAAAAVAGLVLSTDLRMLFVPETHEGPVGSASFPSTERGGHLRPDEADSSSQDVRAPSATVSANPTELTLASGAYVTADSGARFSLAPGGSPGVENVRLSVGRIRLRVPKLVAGQRLFVTTREAVVEVRGTVFEVARQGDDTGGVTEVSVVEGRVTVSSDSLDVLLVAGDSWRSSAPLASGSVIPSASSRAQGQEMHPGVTTDAAKSSAADSGNLARQNEIYRAALESKKRGDHVAARRTLQRLLSLYPESPLRVAALRELERLPSQSE